MKVFIADSNEIVYQRLTRLVSGISGNQIVSRSEIQENILESIQETMPDLAILDLEVEKGKGIEILSKLKQKHSQMVVIVLSNFPSKPFRKACVQAGADFFLDKSDIQTIQNKIESLSRRYTHFPGLTYRQR